MRGKMLFTIAAAIFFLSLNHNRAQAQTDDSRRFEVGGQFSVLNVSNGRVSILTPVPCIIPPCPVITSTTEGRKAEPGFGARIGYHLTRNFALEAEGNFFPREREFAGGRKSQAHFGVKAGKRFERVGVFAKARPGFVHFSEGDFQDRPNGGCVTLIFPPPIGCFEARGRAHFAFDAGGVFEYYPSPRTIIRFDAGDTVIRLGERRVPIVVNSDPVTGAPVRVVAVTAPSETTHNFQGSIGFGYRF